MPNSIDQRTEQNHIDNPADSMGASLTSDFSREEAPLTETTESLDHRFHRPQAQARVNEPESLKNENEKLAENLKGAFADRN